MTNEEMLTKLGTTQEEFDTYRRKASKFVADLTPGELKLHERIQPPSDPLKLLGPQVTRADLERLLSDSPNVLGTITSNIFHQPTGPGGPGHGGPRITD